ncbi:MAG: hypothetical protein OXG39_04905 [Chloroflexi bacterium]|nr:hypothetical protein [Chloroflexota bacterium]
MMMQYTLSGSLAGDSACSPFYRQSKTDTLLGGLQRQVTREQD